MPQWLVPLLVAYCAAGLLVYALSDTSDLASRVESSLLFVPYALVLETVLFVVAAFWPLWLASRWRRPRGDRPRPPRSFRES
jgi:hypothetical protein